MNHQEFIQFHLGLDRFSVPPSQKKWSINDDRSPVLDRSRFEGTKVDHEHSENRDQETVWDSHDWFKANSATIHRLYPGKWVVVHSCRVESAHDSQREARTHVRERGWRGTAIIWHVRARLRG